MDDRGAPGASWWLHVALAVVCHPSLWFTAVRQIVRLAPTRWWRRPPHLPIPPADYLRFRLETQYGTDRSPEPADVVTYLRWCRSMGHLA